jgi:hypothetical protein
MATYPLSESYADGQVLTAADVNSITEGVNDVAILVQNAQTGTTYTLALTDVAKTVTLTNASPITLSVPTNAVTAFPIGTQILLYQGGAGQVTVSAVTPGTTSIRAQGSKTKIAGQYGVACLLKLATDIWVLFGNTSA